MSTGEAFQEPLVLSGQPNRRDRFVLGEQGEGCLERNHEIEQNEGVGIKREDIGSVSPLEEKEDSNSVTPVQGKRDNLSSADLQESAGTVNMLKHRIR